MHIAELRNSRGEIWLNIASGDSVIPGFVNLDNNIFLRLLPYYTLLRPAVPSRYRPLLTAYRDAASRVTFLRRDCRKPIPLPDGTVDHILCSHFLEHVKADEARGILADFHRALRPGATLHLVVPDLALAATQYLSRLGQPDAADDFQRFLGLHFETRDSLRLRLMHLWGGFGLTHQWRYDAASLSERVVEAGFNIVEGNSTPSAMFRKDDGSLHLVAKKAGPDCSPTGQETVSGRRDRGPAHPTPL
jgi:predicted SAM-dependent methyltransferase